MTSTTNNEGASNATDLVDENDRPLADLSAAVRSKDHRVVAYTARVPAEQLAAEPEVVSLGRRLPDGSGEAMPDEIGRRRDRLPRRPRDCRRTRRRRHRPGR